VATVTRFSEEQISSFVHYAVVHKAQKEDKMEIIKKQMKILRMAFKGTHLYSKNG